MRIIPYEQSMLAPLTRLYNRAAADVPFCFPAGEDALARALGGDLGGRSRHCALESQQVLVASDDAGILGFVHTGVGTIREDTERRGVVRFFWYEPGHRAAGQALLGAAHEYCREAGALAMTAFDQVVTYPMYHLESAHLSDRMGHVSALLALDGYSRAAGEVFLEWRDFDPAPFECERFEGTFTVKKLTDGPGPLPDIQVQAHHDDEDVGVCDCLSMRERTPAAEADEWAFVTWLGVDEEYRGIGLGKALLLRALGEARRLGYRHTAISTEWTNHRALLFYANVGYRVVDWTYSYAREL